MKKFNQVISIEVAVDSIANLLLQSFAADFKHKEMVTEAVISTALLSNNLSYVYNSLNGFTADIDFKVGEEVMCSEKEYMYDVNGEQTRLEIGLSKVIEINVYSDQKLKVEFNSRKKDGTFKVDTKWVQHTNANKIQMA